jgi:hypothetical protein
MKLVKARFKTYELNDQKESAKSYRKSQQVNCCKHSAIREMTESKFEVALQHMKLVRLIRKLISENYPRPKKPNYIP